MEFQDSVYSSDDSEEPLPNIFNILDDSSNSDITAMPNFLQKLHEKEKENNNIGPFYIQQQNKRKFSDRNSNKFGSSKHIKTKPSENISLIDVLNQEPTLKKGSLLINNVVVYFCWKLLVWTRFPKQTKYKIHLDKEKIEKKVIHTRNLPFSLLIDYIFAKIQEIQEYIQEKPKKRHCIGKILFYLERTPKIIHFFCMASDTTPKSIEEIDNEQLYVEFDPDFGSKLSQYTTNWKFPMVKNTETLRFFKEFKIMHQVMFKKVAFDAQKASF